MDHPSAETQKDVAHRREDRLLSWPGEGLDCINSDDGWTVVEAPGTRQQRLWAPVERLGDFGAAAILGQRILGLRALDTILDKRATLVYADLPRLGFYHPEDGGLELSTWLTLVESHLRESLPLLAEDGYLAVHIDEAGAAYARTLLDDLLGDENHVATALWQKKYAPQNDLRGRIDDGHDFVLVYCKRSAISRAVPFDNTWWSYDVAGKTEDATREFEKLRNDGVITLADIPKTSKPRKLLSLLLDKLTKPGDIVVELFSDTAFASMAAISINRVPIYLVGGSSREYDVFERCGKPAILNSLRGLSKARDLVVRNVGYSKPPKKVRLNIKQTPIAYGPAQSRPRPDAKQKVLKAIRICNPDQLTINGLGCPSMAVAGSRIEVLAALEPVVRCDARLAWCDFVTGAQDSVDVSNIRTLFERVPPLLQSDGVLAAFVPDHLYASAKLTCDALFGRQQHVGTIAVQRPATQHAFIVVYRALPPVRAKKVGLPANHEYTNPDGDPRGAWRDPGHKGARGGNENTAFALRIPPYRWELVDGILPPGCWRINPLTGVIFAPRLTQAGRFDFSVKVTDSAGSSSVSRCQIEVLPTGQVTPPTGVPFLFAPTLLRSKTPPVVTTKTLAPGVVGNSYSGVLDATGGAPYDELKRPGKETADGKRTRYWEFSRDSLTRGVLEDRVNFGRKGESSPSFKVHEGKLKGYGTSVELSWWDQERLGEESAFSRLQRIFTKDGDLVVSMWTTHPTSDSTKRLIAVLGDAESGATSGAEMLRCELTGPIVAFDVASRTLELDYGLSDFRACLCWIEGFLPLEAGSTIDGVPDRAKPFIHGVTSDRREAFHLLDWTAWPTNTLCEQLHDAIGPHFQRTHIYYYRGEPPKTYKGLVFHRIPFGLNSRPKG